MNKKTKSLLALVVLALVLYGASHFLHQKMMRYFTTASNKAFHEALEKAF